MRAELYVGTGIKPAPTRSVPDASIATEMKISLLERTVCELLHRSFAQTFVASPSLAARLSRSALTEACMRRYLGFAVAAVAVLALTMIVWAKSSGVTSSDVRSSASISPHDIMSKSKDLPVQQIDNLY